MTNIMAHSEGFATKETSMPEHEEGRSWRMKSEDSKQVASIVLDS